jgi:hypothetical protein
MKNIEHSHPPAEKNVKIIHQGAFGVRFIGFGSCKSYLCNKQISAEVF